MKEKEFKKLCENKGYHCPEFSIVLSKVADAPLYLRLWFEQKAREDERQEVIKTILEVDTKRTKDTDFKLKIIEKLESVN